MKVLTNIPYPLEVETVLSRMHSRSKEKHANAVKKLINNAKEKINPVILYKICPVHHSDESSVFIGEVMFKSRILRVNLENAESVFPYILTCGKTFDDFYSSLDDMMDHFYLNEIVNVILSEVQSYFLKYLKETYALEKVSKMNPGSLADWPLEQQKPLFALFDESVVAEQIEVYLNENMLMTPVKSLSGIAFPTEVSFENCQMCPKKDCPGRKAPYDENMENLYFKTCNAH